MTANFRKVHDRNDWRFFHPIQLNAFYLPQSNTINICPPILSGMVFNVSRPRYMNYGALGFVCGHEITHGFDDQGSQRDGDGNIVNWWQPETKKKYKAKTKCIIEQYGNYSVEIGGKTVHLNGINTQGENIADNGGIKEAYKAYQQSVREHGEELPLPELGYTPTQLFWLSAASFYCEVNSPLQQTAKMQGASHSPGRFRVIGAFSNSPQFASDWKCPAGSPMNPTKKCSVW